MIWLAFLYFVIGAIYGIYMYWGIRNKISLMAAFSLMITWPISILTIIFGLLFEIMRRFNKFIIWLFSRPVLYLVIILGLILYSILSNYEPVKAGVITGETHIAGMPVLMEKLDEPVYPYEIELLAEVMYHENWHTDTDHLAAYYTGAVVMNRVNAKCWPNSIYKVLYQKGQYSTTHKFFTKTLPEDCYHMAVRVFKGTPDVPKDVVFQAMFKQGRGVWKVVKTDYFCYGRIE